MQTEIRKISIGKDYPDKAMHFLVGKQMNLQGIPYIISSIQINKEYALQDKIAYDIFLANESGSVLWKTVYDVPVVVENNINFD